MVFAPMIYVITLRRRDGWLPPYFADAPPDVSAIGALPSILETWIRVAYLRYD